MLDNLRTEIKKAGSPERAKASAWFFKTGKGQYGEGDVFVGIAVPDQRKIALQYKTLPLTDITKLLQSKIHEERMIALLILVSKYQDTERKSRSHFAEASRDKEEMFDFYLAHTKFINNWDLVDLSADKIVGEYLWNQCHPELDSGSLIRRLEIPDYVRNDNREILTVLAKSDNLWERRIAMVATYAFIKNGEAELALQIADILINDKEDLIQKAVGWMLREVGKRVSQEAEEDFLKTRYKTMPRTMLRYAIEKFPEEKRRGYLAGTIECSCATISS